MDIFGFEGRDLHQNEIQVLSYTSCMPYKRQDKLWQVMHFQQTKKEAIFFWQILNGQIFFQTTFW